MPRRSRKLPVAWASSEPDFSISDADWHRIKIKYGEELSVSVRQAILRATHEFVYFGCLERSAEPVADAVKLIESFKKAAANFSRVMLSGVRLEEMRPRVFPAVQVLGVSVRPRSKSVKARAKGHPAAQRQFRAATAICWNYIAQVRGPCDQEEVVQTVRSPENCSSNGPCPACGGEGCPWCQPETHGLPPRSRAP